VAYKWNGAPELAAAVEPVVELPQSVPAPLKAAPVFDPSRCGTPAGYKQHRKHGTPQCDGCLAGNAAYSREYRDRRKRGPVLVKGFKPDKCGSYAGYARHLAAGLPPCTPCAVAHADYMHAYRAARKAAA
jgi:hypothetical protein